MRALYQVIAGRPGVLDAVAAYEISRIRELPPPWKSTCGAHNMHDGGTAK